jgi:hypothetical protein
MSTSIMSSDPAEYWMRSCDPTHPLFANSWRLRETGMRILNSEESSRLIETESGSVSGISNDITSGGNVFCCVENSTHCDNEEQNTDRTKQRAVKDECGRSSVLVSNLVNKQE